MSKPQWVLDAEKRAAKEYEEKRKELINFAEHIALKTDILVLANVEYQVDKYLNNKRKQINKRR